VFVEEMYLIFFGEGNHTNGGVRRGDDVKVMGGIDPFKEGVEEQSPFEVSEGLPWPRPQEREMERPLPCPVMTETKAGVKVHEEVNERGKHTVVSVCEAHGPVLN
jgi:hypothetical protein